MAPRKMVGRGRAPAQSRQAPRSRRQPPAWQPAWRRNTITTPQHRASGSGGAAPPRTGSGGDIIGQDLRLPPGVNAVVEVVAGQDAGKVFRFVRGNVAIGRRMGEVPLAESMEVVVAAVVDVEVETPQKLPYSML